MEKYSWKLNTYLYKNDRGINIYSSLITMDNPMKNTRETLPFSTVFNDN